MTPSCTCPLTTPRRRRAFPSSTSQHGGGEDETGWIRQGKANFILDNLIASRNTKPMVVVMANGYATRAGSDFGRVNCLA